MAAEAAEWASRRDDIVLCMRSIEILWSIQRSLVWFFGIHAHLLPATETRPDIPRPIDEDGKEEDMDDDFYDVLVTPIPWPFVEPEPSKSASVSELELLMGKLLKRTKAMWWMTKMWMRSFASGSVGRDVCWTRSIRKSTVAA